MYLNRPRLVKGNIRHEHLLKVPGPVNAFLVPLLPLVFSCQKSGCYLALLEHSGFTPADTYQMELLTYPRGSILPANHRFHIAIHVRFKSQLPILQCTYADVHHTILEVRTSDFPVPILRAK